ncbi:dihydrofolate synthase / folylpolyglutamate synthase [Palleronia marisminoris]|uniref:Dihydrofolate synthase/folylpolyglutamate synthase n=1 Tax=Palleronia marisminoris TaxID=315423 RepID=A0A1Y5T2V5_9RHOB|nr:folylpolyglutamate synthase/dihydrofolate synthase family protein [Palleronia marisminoris]SFH09502.1 dihydrofolate synthase / folylpolyglutamate synthase [Palleronia marisminoris]SLN52562.1 Bifunctional protein FolC [Palleronia marisminoris]
MTSDAILARLMGLHPKIIDLTLDRMWRVLDALGNPQDNLPPVIHIAGTNGKGSTQAMIRAGLESQGDRVHAYTSPHLARFHERIRLAGELISEDALSDLLDEVEAANGGQPITFFEVTTAAALLAFARTPADWTLLEVGLGGRLDATNVMTPALSIIAPVSIDHQQYLGETLPEIAGEKAGILKRLTPAVIGPQEEPALDVIEDRLRALGCPALIHGQHWHVWEERGRLVFQDERGLLDLPLPSLPGPHQMQNAGIALAALRHLGADEGACEAAVTRPHWPARMQRLREGPLVRAAGGAELWLDGGHNPAAGEVVAATIAAMPVRDTHVICGMLNTKDVAGFLRPLAGVANSLTAVSIPGEANTLSADDTAAAAEKAGFAAGTAPSVMAAIERIAEGAPGARILICGSLYLAGRVLQENG